ncbi:bipA [Symbiodinium sp. KB8]|nr:bipA [Symbiodinium sp. KB8]
MLAAAARGANATRARAALAARAAPFASAMVSTVRQHLGFGVRCKTGAVAEDMIGSCASEWKPTDRKVRNVAVIAHVDHGKTSLVDCLLQASGEFGDMELGDRVMDSDQIEMERGITILSKCTSFSWGEGDDKVLFNIVDTPGHADFGGEVERVLHMVDAVMLVVCAREGPMPQTRFVLSKALAKGLSPLVVFNKADREDARLGEVEDEVLDLLISLDAQEHQLDHPTWYTSAKDGWATEDIELTSRTSMAPLLDALRAHVPPPKVIGNTDTEPFRMLVSQISVDPYVGKLALGRIASGRLQPGDSVRSISLGGEILEEGTITKLMARRGTGAVEITEAQAGDIVEVAGLSTPDPTYTVCATNDKCTRPLFADPIDPPTLSMAFAVNDSPLAGREGTKLTSAQLQKRLYQEAIVNVAIDVEQAPPMEGMSEAVAVSGRGELQLAVLIENLRREGFELSIGPPRVVFRTNEQGKREEPYEELRLDGELAATLAVASIRCLVLPECTGSLIESLARRKGDLREFVTGSDGMARLFFHAPSRSLLGFQSEFKTETKGRGVMNRLFDGYGPYNTEASRTRKGALVSSATGTTSAYSLEGIEARGTLFIGPQTAVYAGMVIGEHVRDLDLEVNPVKAKKLTNMRASGTDEAIKLQPPRLLTLEDALTWIGDDELLEVTPSHIRCRKQILDSGLRKVSERGRR